MKKTFITVCLTLGLGSAAFGADGGIKFGNNITTGMGTGLKAITNTDGTTPLAGSGFSVQVYFGSAGITDPGMLMQYMGANNTLGFAAIPPIGVIASQPVITLPGIAQMSSAAIQLRAWDNMGGSVTSWESATVRGESSIFDSLPLGDPLNASVVPQMNGLNPFQLQVIPEPSTVALGVIGGLALLMRRRRK